MYDKPIEEIYKSLNTSVKGLTTLEAEKRLDQYGFNEIEINPKTSIIKIILRQFSSPLLWILFAAIIISIFFQQTVEAIVIGIILILNAIIGFALEFKAERALFALHQLSPQMAFVLRNNKETKIHSDHLVPGDIIFLSVGSKVPADARLIEVHDVETQEAALTGESFPIQKIITPLPQKTILAERKNMVYASTIITKGRGKAVITTTGMNTEVGKIAHLLQKTETKTIPFQAMLQTTSKTITIAVIIIAILIFVLGILTGQDTLTIFLTAIALAVAAVPEGLPAIITIALALGAQRMAKRNAIIRRLPAVESLGSINVICTDKTGTLTMNEMTVTHLWANKNVYSVTGTGYSTQGSILSDKANVILSELKMLLLCGALCNDTTISTTKKQAINGDPTEAALLISAQKGGINLAQANELYPRIDEIAFTSERKVMTTIHQSKKTISFTKGAPDILLQHCNQILLNGTVQRLDHDLKKQILQQNNHFGSQALRVLAFAYNENSTKETAEQNFIFLGLQAMIDPPRAGVKESIAQCHRAGIKVMMITGDHPHTAKAIADQLGITGKIITHDELNSIIVEKKIDTIGVIARVDPEQKVNIVNALQNKGYAVAMTGDGINDAPALHKADIGIAMGITGTDVAKESAEIILVNDNFTSIVNAIEEGRGLYDNIQKATNYLLSSNIAEILVIAIGILVLTPFFGTPLPLTALQILWINLITDGLPAVALSVDRFPAAIMNRKPRERGDNLLSKEQRQKIISIGVTLAVVVLILFLLYRNTSIEKSQTVVFTSLILFEIARLHFIRREYHNSFFSNKWLIAAIIVSFGLHLIVVYSSLGSLFGVVPLELIDWIRIGIGGVVLGIIIQFIGFVEK